MAWEWVAPVSAATSTAIVGGIGVWAMAEADIPRIVEQVVADPYANPRPVTRDGVTALPDDAWSGRPPRS